jgi:uncharacterized membrane protein HdeD (DUF308 family)/pimeloyl-ACP methyl ester carboxylesterase
LSARRLPWWFSLALGLAGVALGVYMIAEPFRALTLLATLVAIALLLGGAGELAGASAAARPWHARLSALASLVAGVLALAWPAITIVTLAVIAGLGVLVAGLASLRLAGAEQGEERLLASIGGLAGVIVGVLALAWPAITVLALAVMFGVRTFLLGCAQLAVALRPMRMRSGVVVANGRVLAAGRARPRPIRWSGALAALLVALAGAGLSVALHASGPPRPGPFYAAPSPLPDGPPGTLIREEPIARLYRGAKAYRILYKSVGFNGRPTAVSGLVVVPEGAPPKGGRKVIAFTHGTVGVASYCAPSLQVGNAVQTIEGLGAFIAAGYVVAATDYQGLGTPGPHPYLIGRVEAVDALDAVRAAHRLRAAHAGVDFAVWGHSQGGQAALFTAELASGYAPDLHLVGAAAGAPVPDLIDLFKVNIKTTVGKVLIAMAMSAWEGLYGEARLAKVLTAVARPAVAAISRRCLYGREILAGIPSALLLNLTFAHRPPWGTEPWRTIAHQNAPGQAPIGVPVLITQGGADQIVPPHITARLVRRLCATGDRVDERVYPSVGHLEAGIVASPDVAAWIAERFAGRPAPQNCP